MTSNLTTANLLTLSRLLMVPVFLICMLYDMPGEALLVFAIAAVTDLFDGLVARLTGQSTALGAWLDPMADKILLLTMFVMLTVPNLGQVNRLPVWLTVLVISRDVGIVLTVAIFNLAVARRTFKPSIWGKAATGIYVITGVVTLYYNYRREVSPHVRELVYLSLAITLISGFDYVRRATRSLP
jgi:cardiolipin synthase